MVDVHFFFQQATSWSAVQTCVGPWPVRRISNSAPKDPSKRVLVHYTLSRSLLIRESTDCMSLASSLSAGLKSSGMCETAMSRPDWKFRTEEERAKMAFLRAFLSVSVVAIRTRTGIAPCTSSWVLSANVSGRARGTGAYSFLCLDIVLNSGAATPGGKCPELGLLVLQLVDERCPQA
jgi:hypothetical protein